MGVGNPRGVGLVVLICFNGVVYLPGMMIPINYIFFPARLKQLTRHPRLYQSKKFMEIPTGQFVDDSFFIGTA